MQADILTIATKLADDELLARLPVLAGKEREASAELVAHLAVLDTRPALYAADGYGSLFSYCTRALALSEDAACNRIEAARVCRRFPDVLELLASGTLSLTTLRLLGRHLTQDNHRAVLSRAKNQTRREIELLVAELAPRPDVPSFIRALPSVARETKTAAEHSQESRGVTEAAPRLVAPDAPVPPPAPRPIVEPLAPRRYGLHCTIDEETQDGLRRLQALLRREIPDGDLGVILRRAVAGLLEKIERKKLYTTARPQTPRAIRPGTDCDAAEGPLPPRTPPNAVKRAVWVRDEGRCAFVSSHGRRCEERTFLEFHHRLPHGKRGEATVDNIALHCRRHNQFEAELVFGDPAAGTPSRPGATLLPSSTTPASR